ncbi:MAG: hypothetical protein KF745_12315 [Phycisphaeraceae bacterium]|nr:hypothetical protein [Phycisphaeraceae bacterium]
MAESNKRAALIAEIQRLSDEDPRAVPCVESGLFFDGNDDEASIGCNLSEHPGMDAFRATVDQVRARPEVGGILAQVCEVMDDPDWPFVDTLLVCSTASQEQIAGWFERLSPDDVYEADTSGLVGVPPPPPGYRWWAVWWD